MELLLLLRTLVALYIVRLVTLVIYRLYFHPLSHIPGPFLGRISYLWELYYDVYRDGLRIHQLARLHKIHGPVIRISPDYLHISDPEGYQIVFRQGSPFLKNEKWYEMVIPGETASLVMRQPSIYRPRREILNPMFSKRAITELSVGIREKTDYLCKKFAALGKAGEPVPIQNAMYCITVDIISDYSFGKAFGMLDAPNFVSQSIENVLALSDGLWISYHFPILKAIAVGAPRWLAEILAKNMMELMWWCEDLVNYKIDGKSQDGGKKRPDTIFDALMAPKEGRALPTFDSLRDEAIIILLAGTDTTANTLTFAVWYYTQYPEVKAKLLKEMEEAGAFERELTLPEMENLTYLTAFIKETLRLSNGVPGALPRTVPAEGFTLPSNGTFIPAGTSIGFSQHLVHRDPAIWGDPEAFRPERWLGEQGKSLDKWLVAFSKGSRICLGINLAYAELYIVIVAMFTRFQMEVYETTEDDMTWCDKGICHTKGRLRVTVKPTGAE